MSRTKEDLLKLEDAVGGPGVFKPAAVVSILSMASLLVTLALTNGSASSVFIATGVLLGGLVYVIKRGRRLWKVARPIFEENPEITAEIAVATARQRIRERR